MSKLNVGQYFVTNSRVNGDSYPMDYKEEAIEFFEKEVSKQHSEGTKLTLYLKTDTGLSVIKEKQF